MRVREHSITLDGAPVFFLSAPSGPEITPLYLHGIPTSSEDWRACLERTGGIAVDLPGFGRSAKGGNLDYSADGHADFLQRLQQDLGLDRVSLVCHDWGACGGLRFAALAPDRVARLVLINALPLPFEMRWQGLPRLWRSRFLGELTMGFTGRWVMDRWLRGAAAEPERYSREEVRAIYAGFDQGTQRAILRLHRSVDPTTQPEFRRGLDRLSMPSLVVWGKQDPWRPITYAHQYAEALPRSERVETEGGHWPWRGSPEVVERIAAFLGAP